MLVRSLVFWTCFGKIVPMETRLMEWWEKRLLYGFGLVYVNFGFDHHIHNINSNRHLLIHERGESQNVLLVQITSNYIASTIS